MLQRTKYEGEIYARLSIIVESDSKYTLYTHWSLQSCKCVWACLSSISSRVPSPLPLLRDGVNYFFQGA